MHHSNKILRFALTWLFVLSLVLAACTTQSESTQPYLPASSPTTTTTSVNIITQPTKTSTSLPTETSVTVPADKTPLPQETPILITSTYEVIATFPHDSNAFTEGLYYENGFLYESTGLYGHSSMRKVDLQSGSVIQKTQLAEDLFGEGLTVVGDKIYQLTWKANTGFIYDRKSFDRLGEFHYPTEGWGLTYDGEYLIMSDGTSTIHFLDISDFHEAKKVDVTFKDEPVTNLNELEYVNGEILANVWKTANIMRIDPQSGEVIQQLDMQDLIPLLDTQSPIDVLNGIAYNPDHDSLYVTGKYWPKIFEIKLIMQ